MCKDNNNEKIKSPGHIDTGSPEPNECTMTTATLASEIHKGETW